MAMTASRRKNLIKAIREGLLLSSKQASEVVDQNWILLATMDDHPFHNVTVVAEQSMANHDYSGSAGLYIGDKWIGGIRIPAGLMKPILTTSITRAYGLPNDLVESYEREINPKYAFRGVDWLDEFYGPMS